RSRRTRSRTEPGRRGRARSRGPCGPRLPPALSLELDPGDAERDEEPAEHVPDDAAAVRRRHDEERETDPDEDRAEDEDRVPVPVHVHAAAPAREAVTMTRHGAFRITRSTVEPKTLRRRPTRSLRGEPRTMISASRRSASRTISTDALRPRTSRPTTRTPYVSPIAIASSSSAFAMR